MNKRHFKLRVCRGLNSILALGLPLAVSVAGDQAQALTRNQLQLQLLQSQYLSSSQNTIQDDAYSSFALRLQHETSEHDTFFHGLDMMGLASMDGTEQGYLAGPEFYIGFNHSIGTTPVRWVFGRKRFTWSHFDEEWRLGIWQPNVRWDYLHPTPQGLAGAFLSLGQENRVQLTLFATPAFLPDQGPRFEVVDGQFESSNRWFRQPTSAHTVMNQERRLNYELDRPSERDLVLNSGYGLSLGVGDVQSGPWMRTSWANKPINQMHIGIEGYHSIARLNRYLESVAIVHPMVARHGVISMEVGFTHEEYRGWLSVTQERPRAPKVPEDWEESSLYPSRFVGMAIAHRLPWEGWRNHWIKYSAMSLTQQIPPQSDLEPQDNLESSLDRYPYRDVVGAEWTVNYQNNTRRRVDLGLRYLYSVPERGSLLSAKLELVVNRNTRWDFGVDVLGAEVPATKERGLMSLYRNNDRVTGSYTYVF